MKIIEGQFLGQGTRIGIVVGRFNDFVTSALLDGAMDCLKRHHVESDDITVVHVPGGMEIPLIVKRMANSRRYDAVIALGAVIRGSTTHFEHVSNFATHATAQVGLDASIPVMNGVLTVESIEQAIERAGTKAGNKGWDCAMAALEMVDVMRQLDEHHQSSL